MSTDQPESRADDRVQVAPAAHRGRRSTWRRVQRPGITAVALGFRHALQALLALLLLAGAGLATYSVLSGNWTIAPVLSGSMRPGFPVGGVVVAMRVPMSQIAVGDVILFQNPDQPSEQTVHRVTKLKVDESGQPVVNTKGDANNVDDPWTVGLRGQSVYVAQFTLPLLGYAAVSTNRGIDLMIGGAILLLVALSTVMSRERREKARVSQESPRPAGVTASAPPDGIPG